MLTRTLSHVSRCIACRLTPLRKGRSRRKFIHEVLGLDKLPVAESNLSVSHTVQILRRVAQVLPHLARIPSDSVFQQLQRRKHADTQPAVRDASDDDDDE